MNEIYPQLFFNIFFKIALNFHLDFLGRWSYKKMLQYQGCNMEVFNLDNWKEEF